MSKLVKGVGVNDMPKGSISHKSQCLPFYQTWTNLLSRTHLESFWIKQPAYRGCTMSPEWLTLSIFKEWYDENFVEGWQLDKDLLIRGNMHYSPETCRYVPKALNTFDNQSKSGTTGTAERKGFNLKKPWQAFINIEGSKKKKMLGYHETQAEAYHAHFVAKTEQAHILVDRYRGQVSDDVLDSILNRYPK